MNIDLLTDKIPSNVYIRENCDKRPFLTKTSDKIISVFRQFKYWCVFIHDRIKNPAPPKSGTQVKWKADSKGLAFFVHGLRSDPAVWSSHRSLLEEYPDIEVFAPIVNKRGLCSLKEAVDPLLKTLQSYTQEHPSNPVFLFGHSNGARVVTDLETELRDMDPNTPVVVFTVGGVNYGSTQMNLLGKLGLANLLYPKALVEELKHGSQEAINLTAKVNQIIPENCAKREYHYYATGDDVSVPDLDSSLSTRTINNQITTSRHLYFGHSHDSIVAAVAKTQINTCLSYCGL